eukprot:7067369-Prymnesium_polylepis.2
MRFKNDNKFTRSDEEWVVKEGRHERTEAEEEEFHRKALVAQSAAKVLSTKFNQEAEALGWAVALELTRVAIAPCRSRSITAAPALIPHELASRRCRLDGMPKVSYMTCCFIQTGQMERRAGEVADPDERQVRSLFAERYIEGEFRKVTRAAIRAVALRVTVRSAEGSPLIVQFALGLRFSVEHQLWGDGADGGAGRRARRRRGPDWRGGRERAHVALQLGPGASGLLALHDRLLSAAGLALCGAQRQGRALPCVRPPGLYDRWDSNFGLCTRMRLSGGAAPLWRARLRQVGEHLPAVGPSDALRPGAGAPVWRD